MIHYRNFLNTDPPEIVRIWRSQPERHRFATSFSHSLFENMVLSKPFFEAAGFFVATNGVRVVGFVHAGFAPDHEWNDLNYAEGVISLMLIDQDCSPEDSREIGAKLIGLAEQYLAERGSTRIYIGSRFPEGPFYLGLFGGSQIPGLLPEHQPKLVKFLQEIGYQQIETIHIFQRKMGDFRPVIDRQQTLVRRNYQIEAVMDPQPLAWWESCTLGDTDRTRFLLFNRKSNEQAGQVMFWDIQPLSRDWGVRTMGLYDLRIERDSRKSGLATYLVGESIKHMQQYGISLVEAQVRSGNEPAMRLFQKFGFDEVNHGVSLMKTVAA